MHQLGCPQNKRGDSSEVLSQTFKRGGLTGDHGNKSCYTSIAYGNRAQDPTQPQQKGVKRASNQAGQACRLRNYVPASLLLLAW